MDSSGIDWTWFTGIRIGLVKEYFDSVNFNLNRDFPLVILVHVTPGSTNFNFGSRVAWAIKRILVHRGLPNIHVEMREGEVSEHSVPKELGPAVKRDAFVDASAPSNATITEAVLPLLPALGWTVQRSEGMSRSRTRAGTVGLYVRLGFKDGGSKRFAITCYHVLMPDWKTTDKRITIKNAEPKVPVSMADDQTYWGVIHRLRQARNLIEERMTTLRASTENPTDKQKAAMSGASDSLKYADKLLDIVKTVNDDETGNTKNPEKAFRKGTGLKKRVIGTIWATPDYVVAASGDFKGFWNDYVLLSLENELMGGAANEFYLSWEFFRKLHSVDRDTLGAAMEAVMAPLPPVLYFTPFQEALQKHRDNLCFMKIQNATSRVGRVTDQHSQGPGAVRVVKSGMHGVTLGVTNGIEACIRDKKAGEPGRPTTSSGSKANNAAHSWEIMVIPFPKTEESRFSQPGDSGASVVDIEGNVVGILVAGAPSGAAPEKAWRGYKDPEILNPLAREPKGFEKGKGPAEAQLKPQGPESVAEPYAPDIWVSFVTPMEFILEDIKRVTGAQSVDILK